MNQDVLVTIYNNNAVLGITLVVVPIILQIVLNFADILGVGKAEIESLLSKVNDWIKIKKIKNLKLTAKYTDSLGDDYLVNLVKEIDSNNALIIKYNKLKDSYRNLIYFLRTLVLLGVSTILCSIFNFKFLSYNELNKYIFTICIFVFILLILITMYDKSSLKTAYEEEYNI